MGNILLFYQYVTIAQPNQVRAWQYKLCQEHGLKGRIIIAQEGINGTIGGPEDGIQAYITAMRQHPLFKEVDFKKSDGGSQDFPRLRVVVRNEIVSTRFPQEITAREGGTHLTPEQAHQLIANKPNDLVLLDGRNWYESLVGTFEDAVTPNTNTFKELPAYIDNNLEQFKDKQVLMFCTGGIRCERASAYLKSKQVTKEVYQIQGGIHRYVEQFPQGFFHGKNYVFDGRVTVRITEDVLTQCKHCFTSCDDFTNCINASCNLQYISCASCLADTNNACSIACQQFVANQEVVIRTKAAKTIDQQFKNQGTSCTHQKTR